MEDARKNPALDKAWLTTLCVLSGLAVFALQTLAVLGPAYIWQQDTKDYLQMFDGVDALLAGRDVYFAKRAGSNLFFAYPPACAALMAPFAIFAPAARVAVWSALHPFALALLVYLSGRLFELKTRREWLYLVSFATVACFALCQLEILEGQINVFVACLVTGGLLLLKRERVFWGTLLLALATQIKVTPAVFGLAFLVCAQWRTLGLYVLNLLLIGLLPLLFSVPALGFSDGVAFNFDMHVYYIKDVLLAAATRGEYFDASMYRWQNLSIPGMLHRLFDANAIAGVGNDEPGAVLFSLPPLLLGLAARFATLGMLGVAAWQLRKHRNDFRLWSGIAILLWLAFQVGNLVFWEHHLLTIIPVFAFLLSLKWPRKGQVLGLISAAFLLVFSVPRLLDFAPAVKLTAPDVSKLAFYGKYGITTLLVVATWGAALYIATRLQKQPGEEEAAEAVPKAEG